MAIGGTVKSHHIDYIMNLINAIGCLRFTYYITTRDTTVVFTDRYTATKTKPL